MEQRVSDQQPEPEQRHFFDIQTGQHLLGKVAVDAHVEAGGHPADIYYLGELLRHTEIVLPHQERYKNINGWSKQESIEAGKWLLSIISLPAKPKEKILNEKILQRAGHLGVMPGSKQITHPQRFGSFSNYYMELGLYDSHRVFYEMTDQDLISYIGDVINELGRLPSAEEIRQRAREDVTKPNYETIYNRLDGILPAAERSGLHIPRNWSPAKCISWGVAFKIANGKLPRQEDVDYFSSRNMAQSATTFRKKFGNSFSKYKNEVSVAFERLDQSPRYKQKFYEIKRDRFIPKDWVIQLEIPQEDLPTSFDGRQPEELLAA